MPRIFSQGAFSVYVYNERGAPHHSPHAHIKERGRQVCSIHLVTLEPLQPHKQVPRGLLSALEAHQEEMLEEWERLNDDD
jgi:hypothetical protein